ncbi:Vanadium-dependent haloperoxidase [Balamuthia mandrillaris]
MPSKLSFVLLGALLLLLAGAPTSAQPVEDLLYIRNNIPVIARWIQTLGGPPRDLLEPPYLLRATAYQTTAWYDAWAQYQDVAVGYICGDVYRRPVEERHNDTLVEEALSYATYYVMSDLVTGLEPKLRGLMDFFGYSLEGEPVVGTPRWVGTKVGQDIINFAHQDGMNQLGDIPGSDELDLGFQHHQRRYLDYTNYRPVNTFDKLKYPDRFQPLMFQHGLDVWAVQSHIVPQIRYAAGFGFSNVYDLPATTLRPYSHRKNRFAYQQQAEDVMARVAGLTETQKILAEYFETKVNSLAFPFGRFVRTNNMDLSTLIHTDFYLNQALWNAAILSWSEKLKFDSVRPVSAIRYLKDNQNILGWGGPGKGTVVMKGREWQSYLKTMQHSEFPSGSACFCTAMVGALTRMFGEEQANSFNYTWTFPAGSSVIEPGLPAQELSYTWATLEEFKQSCGESRINGGVHFPKSVEASFEICDAAADVAWDHYQALLAGTASPKSPHDRLKIEDDDIDCRGPRAERPPFCSI